MLYTVKHTTCTHLTCTRTRPRSNTLIHTEKKKCYTKHEYIQTLTHKLTLCCCYNSTMNIFADTPKSKSRLAAVRELLHSADLPPTYTEEENVQLCNSFPTILLPKSPKHKTINLRQVHINASSAFSTKSYFHLALPSLHFLLSHLIK